MSDIVSDRVQYHVADKLSIITLNNPDRGNAMGDAEYSRFWDLLEIAGKEQDTFATVIQSSGKLFSAGANVADGASGIEPPADIAAAPTDEIRDERVRASFAATIGIRNLHIPESMWNHPKPLIVALNGGVVGFSASIVALADIIYALDTAFILTPFANLGLVTEGAASYTLVERLGWSLASEALLGAKRISADRLLMAGFINELYPSAKYTTEQFNEVVRQDVIKTFGHLDHQSVKNIKKLIHLSKNSSFRDHNTEEAVVISERFASGEPFMRFAQMAARIGKNKM